MADYTRVIEGLKRHAGGGCFDSDSDGGCPYWDDKECARHLAEDALELLKAQKQEAVDAPKPDSDIGCWYDITHNYTLEQVVSALKAQEPVKPKKNDVELAGLRTWDWACPECNCILIYRANYCSCCGRAVKWNDEC